MNSQQTPEQGVAKFMYFSQNFLNDIEQNKRPKVLINPNFMHVKPHFNKKFLVNQTVHVNRNNIRSLQKTKLQEQFAISSTSSSVITTPTKFVRITTPAPAISVNAVGGNNKNTPSGIVVSTRTKLIRAHSSNKKNELSKQRLVSTRTKLITAHSSNNKSELSKRTCLQTKYKIIRKLSLKKQKFGSGKDLKRSYYTKNRFKIDKRSPNKISPLSGVKHNSKLKKINYASLNSFTCKKVVNKKSKVSPKGKAKLLTIRGQKYKLDSNHRTLTLIAKEENVKPNFKTIYLGGATFKQKDKNVFIKTNVIQKRVSSSQAKQRSVNTSTNKMKKSNIPCPLYRKFGRCKGRENGTCIRVHNPNQISICPKFLQGICTKDKCLLSHKVSHEKMPACKFYLDGGLCARDNCPYLHVKIGPNVDICKDFLQGFCKKAAECEKRHQHLCPDFEKCGKCLKRKCPYPHGNGVVVRKQNSFASNLHKINKNHPVVTSKNDKIVDMNLEKPSNLRYYDELSKSLESSLTAKMSNSNTEIIELDVSEENSLALPKKRRPSVGQLPPFIPFLDEGS